MEAAEAGQSYLAYTTIPCHSERNCYLHVIPNVAERSEESKDPCSQDQVRGCQADALDSSTALRALGMTVALRRPHNKRMRMTAVPRLSGLEPESRGRGRGFPPRIGVRGRLCAGNTMALRRPHEGMKWWWPWRKRGCGRGRPRSQSGSPLPDRSRGQASRG